MLEVFGHIQRVPALGQVIKNYRHPTAIAVKMKVVKINDKSIIVERLDTKERIKIVLRDSAVTIYRTI